MNKETQAEVISTSVANDPGKGINSLGIHASVSFGTSQGGPCLGRGVCKLQSTDPGGIDVNFHLSPLDKELLFIVFSLADLTANQPLQVPYFTDSSRTYQFEVPYALDNQFFIPLGLLPNARITSDSRTEVLISKDTVITLIKYDHD